MSSYADSKSSKPLKNCTQTASANKNYFTAPSAPASEIATACGTGVPYSASNNIAAFARRNSIKLSLSCHLLSSVTAQPSPHLRAINQPLITFVITASDSLALSRPPLLGFPISSGHHLSPRLSPTPLTSLAPSPKRKCTTSSFIPRKITNPIVAPTTPCAPCAEIMTHSSTPGPERTTAPLPPHYTTPTSKHQPPPALTPSTPSTLPGHWRAPMQKRLVPLYATYLPTPLRQPSSLVPLWPSLLSTGQSHS